MSYIDQITVDSTTYDIQDSNAQRKTIVGSGAPTTSTVGTLGVHYFDTSATEAPYEYICVDISNGSYTWEPVGSGTEMVVLSYGSSTWAQFEAAYNKNAIVYCKASSNSNPATGSQGRMAFMAFVNFSGTTMTSVEFQYYRSVSSHTDSQQGDQVFIYKLDKSAGWTVTAREAYTKIAAGNGLGSSYSNGVLTLTGNVQTVDGKTGAVSVIPSGGTTGQVLKKSSNTDYAVTWGDVHQVPSGGTQGQVLTKASATDFDTAWANASGGDKVMCVTLTYSSSIYSSDKSIDDIITAVGNGYDVFLKYGTGVYQLRECDASLKRAFFYRVNLYSNYINEYYYRLEYNTNYTNNTRVQYYNSSFMKPDVIPQYYFKVEKTGENSYELYSSNASIGYLDILNSSEFGSAYLFIGEEGSTLPYTNYTQNFTDFYSLTNYWNSEEYVEDYDEYEPFGNAVFSKIGIDNGAVKLKSFTIKQNMWDSDYSTVTYSEVSLGQAPSAQGVSF